jgi:predicted nucleotide-binding protein (sugar kinase/HSP70/actin superfamily)
MMRIGLPRALSYYEYAPLWRPFFEALGAEVVVSGPTTCATLQVATSRSTADLCFPAKVYIGHLLALAGQVDLIFAPSLHRPAPAAIHCAKIIGLPDLARSALPDPDKILAVDVDLDKGPLALAQAVLAAGKPLTWNPLQIARAAQAAWSEYQAGKNHRSGPLDADLAAGHVPPDLAARRLLTLGVVGHPYLLQDEYVNNGLLRRLEGLQVRLVTPDALSDEDAARGVQALTGEAYWAYAPSLIGAGMHLLERGAIDGLVAVIAFGCAPDSGLAPILGEAAHRQRVPMLTLTLDEHSGEAGLMTRLEAFVDMLERVRLPR